MTERDDVMEEGRDFYFENGLMVFTAEFLRRRGFCCRSGCRHCPYDFRPETLFPGEQERP